MTDRVISVGVSRLFRLIERVTEGALNPQDRVSVYRIEQAVQDKLTKKWRWHPLASADEWYEAHGALHQFQADYGDQLEARQQSFRSDRYAGS